MFVFFIFKNASGYELLKRFMRLITVPYIYPFMKHVGVQYLSSFNYVHYTCIFIMKLIF